MLMKMDYAWEEALKQKPTKKLSSFVPQFGPKVTKRDKSNNPQEITFDLFFPNTEKNVHLVGKFCDWKINEKYAMKRKNDHFLTITLHSNEITHNQPYLFKIGNKMLRDPFSYTFDNDGNSLFWDFESNNSQNKAQNLLKRNVLEESLKILQTDLPGLIIHWRDKNGKLGHEVGEKNYFSFIKDSGVIKKLKDLGFNAIQFLPISQSIDGNKWSFRYLAPFLNALNKNWGTPDEFKKMVDEFHKHEIAVILDFVISHVPHKNFKLFAQPADHVGLHIWDEYFDSQYHIVGEETSWGTKRYNFFNSYAQDFVIESALAFLKNYNVDGFRIDNIDGILREGDTGEGNERAYGREILRKFNSTVYEYKPKTIINYESHYFYEDNAKRLVEPIRKDDRALGATAYTSSRLTYFFHTDFMPKAAEEISPWKMQHIIDEKEWGKSNSTIADFHNHDAAAGLMSMRATGSYAYDAMLLKKDDLHYHAIGKIKVMETLISTVAEGRTLDLLQTHLLQTGTFEHDSTIHWYLEMKEANKGVLNFKKAINNLLNQKAFWPIHVKKRKIINIDEPTKTLVIQRESEEAKDGRYLIVINMSAFLMHYFEIPAPISTNYEVVIDSDKFEFSGSGRSIYPEIMKPKKTNNFEFFDLGIELPMIAPYGVVVLKY